MTLVYYYEDGASQTVHGKSERECALKMDCLQCCVNWLQSEAE